MLWSNELYLSHQFKLSNDHRAQIDEHFLRQRPWLKQSLFPSSLHPSLIFFLVCCSLMKPVGIKQAVLFLLSILKQVQFLDPVHHGQKHKITVIVRDLLSSSSPTSLISWGWLEQITQEYRNSILASQLPLKIAVGWWGRGTKWGINMGAMLWPTEYRLSLNYDQALHLQQLKQRPFISFLSITAAPQLAVVWLVVLRSCV